MIRNTKRANNAVHLTQQQENTLNQIITLQITAMQLAVLYKINPKMIEEEMEKRGIL